MSTMTSTGLQTRMLSSGGFKSVMDGAEFRLYAGLVPESADAGIGGATLLCTVKAGAFGVTFDDTTTPGVLLKPAAEAWSGDNVASGTPTFYRLVQSTDAGTASSTEVRVQGTVGVVGADLNLSAGALVAGAPQTISYYAVTLLAD